MNRVLLILIATLLAMPALAKDLVLVSGFDPFGRISDNNSWTIAQAVRNKIAAQHFDIEIVTCLLPTSYARAIPTLEKCLADLPRRPDLVVSLGAGPCNVKWETRAHNKDHDKGPDNDGVSRKRQVIDPNGPAELGLRLNYGAMWCELTTEEKKLTWVSTDPDKFVCNNTAYRFGAAHPELLYGFVHVPESTCEKKNPGITARATDLVAKMISIQLSVRSSSLSRLNWPLESNDVRLATTKDEVRSLQRQSTETCEQEFLSRWRGDF
jgi:pyroglutamyl-peptidase